MRGMFPITWVTESPNHMGDSKLAYASWCNERNASTPCALGNPYGVEIGWRFSVVYQGFPTVTPGYSWGTTPWFSNPQSPLIVNEVNLWVKARRLSPHSTTLARCSRL